MPVQGGEKIAHPLDEELAKQVGQKVYLVHRLDKDTSGLMIVAKTPQAATKWTKLIGSKEVKKEYIAVCAGSFKQKKGQITEDIIQHGQVKRAVTHYQVEKEWQLELEGESPIDMCQIRLALETGRMHQIRAHFASIGHPLLGDTRYGDFALNREVKKQLGLHRLFLHSCRLEFVWNGDKIVLDCPLPKELQAILDQLKPLHFKRDR